MSSLVQKSHRCNGRTADKLEGKIVALCRGGTVHVTFVPLLFFIRRYSIVFEKYYCTSMYLIRRTPALYSFKASLVTGLPTVALGAPSKAVLYLVVLWIKLLYRVYVILRGRNVSISPRECPSRRTSNRCIVQLQKKYGGHFVPRVLPLQFLEALLGGVLERINNLKLSWPVPSVVTTVPRRSSRKSCRSPEFGRRRYLTLAVKKREKHETNRARESKKWEGKK